MDTTAELVQRCSADASVKRFPLLLSELSTGRTESNNSPVYMSWTQVYFIAAGLQQLVLS